MYILEIILMIIITVLMFSTVFHLLTLPAGLKMLSKDDQAYGIKWYECLFLPLEQQYISDRWRNPRSVEIQVLKQQLRLLKNLKTKTAKDEYRLLEAELRDLRQEPILHEQQFRLIDDEAEYQLQKSDIQNERRLREDTTRRVAEELRTLSEHRRDKYEFDIDAD